MNPPPFEQSVFLNCPFDEEFAPLLQAIAFCITDLGFFPRLASENADSAASRLDRILQLIRGSKFGIHDLSRCKAATAGEYARLNMPFELGLDHGCARFGDGLMSQKSILVLEETRFDYREGLSDISGWDIQAHEGNYYIAIRHVSAWLTRQAGIASVGASRIRADYIAFQEWYWERETERGASEEDIKAYPTNQVIAAMKHWLDAGRPQ